MLQNFSYPSYDRRTRRQYTMNHYEELASSVDTKIVQPCEKYEWKNSLRIPPVCPTANDLCCLLKLNYSVKFSCFPDITKSTKLSIPITIGYIFYIILLYIINNYMNTFGFRF